LSILQMKHKWTWSSSGMILTGENQRTQSKVCPSVIGLMMEAVCTSEKLVYFNKTTQCYIPESCHLHTCCHENLKSHNISQLQRSSAVIRGIIIVPLYTGVRISGSSEMLLFILLD
jgi:hypothetical protein